MFDASATERCEASHCSSMNVESSSTIRWIEYKSTETVTRTGFQRQLGVLLNRQHGHTFGGVDGAVDVGIVRTRPFSKRLPCIDDRLSTYRPLAGVTHFPPMQFSCFAL
ncbi:MAG: hypothetical protein JHC61_10910 [Burkholderiaceae bacterium]|nr:hypothetical protein [Burkholderiaceae bacterium]